jgi:osmotically-inducible protein OsmY
MAAIPVLVAVSLVMTLLPGRGNAQDIDREEVNRTVAQIRKEILSLSNYGVFDYLTFNLKRGTVGYILVLQGYASRPSLKKSAERIGKRLEVIESVVNEIEVLPTSGMDEDVRMGVYSRVYYHPLLIRYNPNRGSPAYGPGGFGRARAFGISNDPPAGNHPFSILVKKGHVRLEGVIDTESDKQIATVQANGVSGVFSVTNNLHVLNPSKKQD